MYVCNPLLFTSSARKPCKLGASMYVHGARSVGACDEPTERRGGQPVFDVLPVVRRELDAAALQRRRYEPTSVPLR